MASPTPTWQRAVKQLRTVQAELMRQAPYKDLCLLPNPAASLASVQATERRLGLTLPGTYREFLLSHDGWPRCFEGVSLLGADRLERASRREFGWMLQASSWMSRRDMDVSSLIVFGLDESRSTVLCFDAQRLNPDGEPSVLAWISELGMTASSFAELLELMAQMYRSEVHNLIAQQPKASSQQRAERRATIDPSLAQAS